MNWAGDMIQREVTPDDEVLDLGCGVMQAILNHIPTYHPTRLRCKSLMGVDLYKPYLTFLNDNYPHIKTVQWDLRETPLPFDDDSSDIALLLDVVEHLKTEAQVRALLREAERVARKKIILLTPLAFSRNEDSLDYLGLGTNTFQQHHILITEELLREMGFRVQRLPSHGALFAVKKLRLNILHVSDVAGVGAVMAKYQRKLGHEAQVVVTDDFDGLRFSKVYGSERLIRKECSGPDLYQKALKAENYTLARIIWVASVPLRLYRHLKFCFKAWRYAVRAKPDILHIHSLFLFPFFVPLWPKLIEWHGTEMRLKYEDGTLNERRRVPQWGFKLYSLLGIPLFVSTPDLLPSVPGGAQVIPAPVDLDHWAPRPLGSGALYAHNHYESSHRAQEYAQKYGWQLTIQERAAGHIIDHEDYPAHLSQFDVFIDRHKISSLSKTALECLAMGMRVVDPQGQVLEGLPPNHDPAHVARLTLRIYNEILGGVTG